MRTTLSLSTKSEPVANRSVASHRPARKLVDGNSAIQRFTAPNHTGLPNQLKSGIENLSGFSMNDVRVHYNSPAPAQLQAHAYAQGNDIHIAPGQQQHLAHEAWHVVQQKQGRVKPTMQLKGALVNDNCSLESEADRMGNKAWSAQPVQAKLIERSVSPEVSQRVLDTQLHPNSVVLPPKDQAKMLQVVKYMKQAGAHFNTNLQTIQIVVNNEYGANPASTYLHSGGQHIIVNLADWFVRSSSVGDILGMLSHEIGVHTLADDQQTVRGKVEETQQSKHPFSVQVGLHTHTITPWKDTGGPRQRDHVNVGRDTGKGKEPKNTVSKIQGRRKKLVSATNERAQIYAKVMLTLGDKIYNDGVISKQERYRRLHDLLNSFLFDYARIIATDDIPLNNYKTHLVAQVYNWYKTAILNRYGEKHPWLKKPAVQPTASGWGLRGYLGLKVASGLLEQARTTRVGSAIETLASPITYLGGKAIGVAGAVAQGVSDYTPDSVKSGLSTVGGYGETLLRGVDYAYGEAENLAVNVVSLPFKALSSGWSWLRGK